MSASVSPWPAGRLSRSTRAPAAASAVANFSALDRGAMGSFNPDRISTGTPERSGLGKSVSGVMARNRIAPARAFGCSKRTAAAIFSDETDELARSAAHIVLVEQTFAKAPEEARPIAFEHVAARGEERRAGRDLAAEGHEVGLVATRAMEKENRRKRWVGAGLEAMNISQLGRHHRLPRGVGNCKVRLLR